VSARLASVRLRIVYSLLGKTGLYKFGGDNLFFTLILAEISHVFYLVMLIKPALKVVYNENREGSGTDSNVGE
jgi:hypothetical protein